MMHRLDSTLPLQPKTRISAITSSIERIRCLPDHDPEFLSLHFSQVIPGTESPVLNYKKLIDLQQKRLGYSGEQVDPFLTMDDFATTQAEVDLFEDDFTPSLEPVSGPSAPPVSQVSDRVPYSSWSKNNPGYENGHVGNIFKPTDRQMAEEDVTAAMVAPTPSNSDARPRNKITEPREPREPRESTAVRGDRSGTGGIKKPKMSEEELAERMAKMKLKSEQREKQHDRQEADKAAQSKLEKLNQKKFMEEQKATREQDMERAKNQQRKLRAQGGREWDSEKQESDIVDRSRGQSSMYSRGAHGGVGNRGLDNSRYAADAEPNNEQGGYFRGRGGRGRGGNDERRGRASRGGRGRGNRGGVGSSSSLPPTDSGEAFPPLPAAASSSQPQPQTSSLPNSSSTIPATGPVGAWAEEMATPTAE